jgi:hypothetical protein
VGEKTTRAAEGLRRGLPDYILSGVRCRSGACAVRGQNERVRLGTCRTLSVAWATRSQSSGKVLGHREVVQGCQHLMEWSVGV